MRKNEEIGLWKKLVVFAVVTFAVILIVSLQLELNDLKEQKSVIMSQVEELEDERDELLKDAEAEDDRDYVISKAKKELNLRLPEEIIFYSDLVK